MTKSDLFPSVMIRTIIQNAIHCEFWRRARLGQGNTAHFMNVSTFEHVIAKHRRRIVTFSVKLYSVDVNERLLFCLFEYYQVLHICAQCLLHTSKNCRTAAWWGSRRWFYSRRCRRHCFLFTRYIFALTRSSFTITVFLSKITFDIFLRDFLLGVKNVACRKEWLKVFSSLKSSPLTTQMETCQLFLPWKATNILPDSRVWHRTLNCLINSVIQ